MALPGMTMDPNAAKALAQSLGLDDMADDISSAAFWDATPDQIMGALTTREKRDQLMRQMEMALQDRTLASMVQQARDAMQYSLEQRRQAREWAALQQTGQLGREQMLNQIDLQRLRNQGTMPDLALRWAEHGRKTKEDEAMAAYRKGRLSIDERLAGVREMPLPKMPTGIEKITRITNIKKELAKKTGRNLISDAEAESELNRQVLEEHQRTVAAMRGNAAQSPAAPAAGPSSTAPTPFNPDEGFGLLKAILPTPPATDIGVPKATGFQSAPLVPRNLSPENPWLAQILADIRRTNQQPLSPDWGTYNATWD